MRGIPIDILRAFVAVVEARGFTRAAEELGRTQPTISLQVKAARRAGRSAVVQERRALRIVAGGRRLLRLRKAPAAPARRHAGRDVGRNNPNDTIRIGMPSEFAPILARRLNELRANAEVATTFEVIVDSSQALSGAFRQNALDVAFIIGTGESEPSRIEQWRGQLRWFGRAREDQQDGQALPLVLPPQGWPFHEAAIGALRAQERRFEIVCTCSNFAVLAAAAAAGLGVTPMIDGLAPEGLEACSDKRLPPLPEVTLLLLARSQALALASRRWVENVIEALQSE